MRVKRVAELRPESCSISAVGRIGEKLERFKRAITVRGLAALPASRCLLDENVEAVRSVDAAVPAFRCVYESNGVHVAAGLYFDVSTRCIVTIALKIKTSI